ncbi:phage baseplate assembly protein V [Roseomonas xinghualingensis]|uniref:phage baseplate assembly protein V n=1 Tax=Roseomonas xinghualingensis TaxID=2986475 RepID=UPI0021F136E0|nr:phage baseplate assembly protein V [Roseomonas sp. SXEYE001]MCV4209383.1 phage baseplate assembly protein V [Roseomonas sp. SXEYE001]
MSEPTRGKIVSTRTRGGRALATVLLANGDMRNRVELLMPYGISALPEEGADVMVLEVGGNRDHLVALMADASALRIPGLAPGEVGFRDKRGQQVVLRSDGVEIIGALKVTIVSSGPVEVKAPAVIMTAPLVTVVGNLEVEGTITATQNITGEGVSLRGHRHHETGTGGGTTTVPIGAE